MSTSGRVDRKKILEFNLQGLATGRDPRATETSLTYTRLAGCVYLDLGASQYNGYLDVYLLKSGAPNLYITRVQHNAPGSSARQSLCIVSGEQFPDYDIVHIIVRKGNANINGLGFRSGYGECQPIGMMQGDCVFTSNQTSLSDQRIKTN